MHFTIHKTKQYGLEVFCLKLEGDVVDYFLSHQMAYNRARRIYQQLGETDLPINIEDIK